MLRTDVACHRLPRAVATPRAFGPSAMSLNYAWLTRLPRGYQSRRMETAGTGGHPWPSPLKRNADWLLFLRLTRVIAASWALTECREIRCGLIASHQSRIANTAGDSVLAEFGSAVDAVRCAIDAQDAVGEANSRSPETRHIKLPHRSACR
jgi:hypothetical protein